LKKIIPMLITLLIVTVTAACQAETKEPERAKRIPASFNLPADQFELLQYLDKIDFISMRAHAWNVWAGLTYQPTPDDATIFESWYPADYVFHQDDSPPPAHTRSFKTHFESPKQHLFEPAVPGESSMAHVMYNEPARKHIRDKKLYLRQTLDDMNSSFDHDKTPGWNRTVPEFTTDAVVIKPVWWPIKKGEATALPVWDGPYAPQDDQGIFPSMPANDWPIAVAVVPPGVKPPTDLQQVKGTNPNQKIRGTASLDEFYYFEITQDMIARLKGTEQSGFSHIEAGDYAVLIAMHVTTREINSWAWSTYWWHDKPDSGHLADDRPDSVKGVWAHFLMNTAFSMDTPGAKDKGPHIVYNPYIEGKFVNGVVSNCMACHNRSASPPLATTPANLCGALPITRGSHNFLPTSPDRNGRLKLEFLWSLLFRSQPAPPKCLEDAGPG
jgi:hypothetical protein